tara:strand:- start:14084 stop:16999 length:2916 start_codon:yes stop_codon:yes gene_type:complete
MAFQPVQPMFATGNFYTAKSNFFADYLYTRIKLTDKKNKELMTLELEALSKDQSQLKDEAVRLQTNITNLQRSLLSREQALISKTESERLRGRSSSSSGNYARERRRIRDEHDKDLAAETSKWEKAQRQKATVEEKLGTARTNFMAAVVGKMNADPNFPDPNNAGHLQVFKNAYKAHAGMAQPSGDEGFFFIDFYETLKDDYGDDMAMAFKEAMSQEFTNEDWTQPVLMREAGQGQPSLQAKNRFYDEDEFNRRIVEPLRENRDREFDEARAAAGGTSSTTVSGGTQAGDLDLPGSPGVRATEKLIKQYEARLKQIQNQRLGFADQRADIIENRFGRQDIYGSLSPFEYTDSGVDRILDRLEDIEDPALREQALAEARMVSTTGRQQIAPDFVEANILNPEALAQNVRQARDAQARILAQTDSVSRLLAPLQRRFTALQEQVGDLNEKRDQLKTLRNQGQNDPQLAAEIARLEDIEPEFLRIRQQIEQQQLVMRDLRTSLDSVTAGLSALEDYAQDPRGLERAWSSMSPEQRLTITEGVRVSSLAQADILENTIDATRESIRINEEDIREYESSGATEFADEAKRELEQNQGALNSLLLQQNERISFAAEGQSAIDYLVENDPAYRRQPDDLLGPREGAVGPLSEEALEAQELQQATMGRMGEEEGRRQAAESESRVAATEARRDQESEGELREEAKTGRAAEKNAALVKEKLDFLNDPSMLESKSGIRQIQQAINDLRPGFEIDEDGIMGPQTEKALEEAKRDLEVQQEDYLAFSANTQPRAEGLSSFESEGGARAPGTTAGQALPNEEIDSLPDSALEFKELEATLDSISIPTASGRYQRPLEPTLPEEEDIIFRPTDLADIQIQSDDDLLLESLSSQPAPASQNKASNSNSVFNQFYQGSRRIQTPQDFDDFATAFNDLVSSGEIEFGSELEKLGKLVMEQGKTIPAVKEYFNFPDTDDSLLEQNMYR